MAGMSVSGLTTGLDVSSMVTQLMAVERQQGNSILTAQKRSQSLVSTLTSLNTQMKGLGDAAKALAPTSILDESAFSAVKATSSDESIAKVVAGKGASAGTLTFSVSSIAQAGSTVSAQTFAGETPLSSEAFEFGVTVGDKTTNVKVGPNAKLADVVAAINKQAGTDVKATMVQVASGTYKLQISSLSTGAQSNVSITDSPNPPFASDVLGSFNTLTQGKDTELTVGSGPGAFTVTSSTREVKDVLPGVTITPVKADADPLNPTSVTINLTSDADAMADKVAAFVKAANDALGTIDSNSKWDPVKKTGGAFVGDSTTRDLSNRIQSAFVGSSAYLPSMAGVELQKNGSIKFDKAKFTAAYANDPEAVTKNVTALATKINEVSKQATNATDGSLSIRIQGEQANIKDYTDRVAKFEDRMTAKQAMYQQQFSALDSMLSKLQAQGNWLNGQLAGLYSR